MPDHMLDAICELSTIAQFCESLALNQELNKNYIPKVQYGMLFPLSIYSYHTS